MDQQDRLFEFIANFTYDWESWFSEDGSVNWINPAVERITGHSIADCRQMNDYPLPLLAESSRERMKNTLQTACNGSSGNDVEFEFLHKDGGTGWIAMSWQPLHDIGDRAFGFRTSMRDITERKQAEQALKTAVDDAKRANMTKSRFLASVSHDLRQPLQAVSMYLGALANEDLGENQKNLIGDIRLCMDGCHKILDDLVDISRLDAGIVMPKPSRFAIADIIETVESSFRTAAVDKGLDLRIVTSSLFVDADHALLSRIVQNLVANAVRYTERGKILVGLRRRGEFAELQVCDTGPGISPEQQSVIFEEFYQVGNPGRDRQRGLGLGLAIVRRHAELMGFAFGVHSWVGKGSIFWLRVPFAFQGASLEAARVEKELSPIDGLKILVIDDEPVQRNALGGFLKSSGVDVRLSGDLEEARAHLARHFVPDVVIADYRLSDGATGTDSVAALREEFRITLPTIVLTGDTEPGRIADAGAIGTLLHKPVAPEELLNAVTNVAQQNT